MIIDNKEYEISEYLNITNYNNNKLEIKLKGIDNITNMSCMFSGCSSLSSLPDISKYVLWLFIIIIIIRYFKMEY